MVEKTEKEITASTWIRNILAGVAVTVISAGIIWQARASYELINSLSEVRIQLAVLNEKLASREASEKLLINNFDLTKEKVSVLETRVSILESKIVK